MRFLLVRHGESTYNAEGRIQGQQDAPLSERGRQQAERIGERLRTYQFSACYASDLSRAADTARAIMRHHPDLPFAFTTLLREIKFGTFEGRIRPEIAEMYPEEYALWTEARQDYVPPGAESGEDLAARAGRTLHWLRERGHEGTVLVVAHGAFLNAFLGQFLQLGVESRYRFHFDNTALAIVEDQPFGPRLLLANDTSHLGPDAAFP
ncbi:MAG: histidine phosphatase family protein [Thermomicrobia bacterium]|nr:histidine phosphatase family protein [Thermomicrobia bacterium]MCA1724964.1 histidine phosphatase family protein [Thermomicrobia bacterium]